ncbi:hypothetical protein XENOCAPTIV_004074, partial [Xenoophorus captivus]
MHRLRTTVARLWPLTSAQTAQSLSALEGDIKTFQPVRSLNASVAAEPFLNGTSSNYVEELYYAWLEDPRNVHKPISNKQTLPVVVELSRRTTNVKMVSFLLLQSWDIFFRNANAGAPPGAAYQSPPPLSGPSDGMSSIQALVGARPNVEKLVKDHLAVQSLIRAYQVCNLSQICFISHLYTDLVYIQLGSVEEHFFHISCSGLYGLAESDLDKVFRLPTTTYIGGNESALPLREIIRRLEMAYCQHIGVEFMFINDMEQCQWIRQKFETPGIMQFSLEEKRTLLGRMIRSTRLV